jgi:hypothetical protein
MKTKTVWRVVLILALMLVVIDSQSFAQKFPTYHQLGPAKATLWRPTSEVPRLAL